MDTGGSQANCSKSQRENGAASLEPDRPHKKARFPWQIKGKHHLKNQVNESTPLSNTTPDLSETRTAPSNKGISSKSKRAILAEIIPAYEDQNSEELVPTEIMPPMPLETVISLAETMLLSSKIEGNKEYSTASSQDFREQPGPSKAHITVKEARKMRKEEDKWISRWQATQTVKGCFDNTINRVLESWMNSHGPAEERFLELDMARIMNDDVESNDDNVENEGILMAINAHGLQHMGVPTPAIAPDNAAIAEDTGTPLDISNDVPVSACDSDSSICSDDYEIPSERPRSPNLIETSIERIYGTFSDEPVNYGPWSPVHENRNVNLGPAEFAAPEDYEYEFMNTAVIQAMKSKGLMAASMDFG